MRSLNSIFAAIFAVGIGFASAARPQFTEPVQQLLGGLRCHRQAQAQLKEWQNTGDWVKHITGLNGAVVLASPTARLASWTQVRINGREAELELVRPLGVQRVSFSAKCAADRRYANRAPAYDLRGRFTDLQLAQILKQNRRGLIYTWSANMPWSVEGIATVREAAKELKVPVFVVMTPTSDPRLTQELLRGRKVASADAVPHASLEFFMRGMVMHDPSILSFRDGKLARWARPGRESKARLVKYYAKDLK